MIEVNITFTVWLISLNDFSDNYFRNENNIVHEIVGPNCLVDRVNTLLKLRVPGCGVIHNFNMQISRAVKVILI